jgi:ATP-dependent exoDNAse (exonuclease V) beta subunit
MNIRFISAGAGTGKTYRLTELVQDRMEQGTCRPGGLIATTYTVKAANELRERLRQRLYAARLIDRSERMDEAMVGTVHGVCARILGRFAFEAGISPRIEVLSEEQAAAWLSQAVEMVCSIGEIQGIQAVADRLGQEDRQTKTYTWKDVLQQIISQARANDFAPEPLPGMAQRSCEELFAHFPPTAGVDLDAELGKAIRNAIRKIQPNGDTTKVTAEYVELLEACLRDQNAGSLRWDQWVKLTKKLPGRKSVADAAAVVAAAAAFAAHPRFRNDIQDFVGRLFTLAGRALGQYQQLKEERGLLDFGDLEHRTLDLLRGDHAGDTVLAGEIDLLVVDEFQDTSPIQLALFLELARRAREVVWVGDVKQAIYGFRGTDPVLIDTVVQELRTQDTPTERLDKSFRAVPELATLMNALFAPAFAVSLGLEACDVELQADRQPIRPAQPALEFFELENLECNKSDGRPKKLTQPQRAACVASGVATVLGPQSRWQVFDRATKRERVVQPGDIAILCRTNASAGRVAEALSQRGLPVSIGASGLLSTPEVRLAMACLRRLADRTDTLATAEIVALDGTLTAEQWLSNRLDYLAAVEVRDAGSIGAAWGTEPPYEHPVIKALDTAASSLDYLSPSEALDRALTLGNMFAVVTRWGPDATRMSQRRANLEALRGLAVSYEEACRTAHRPATVAGLLFSCDDLAKAKADAKASDEAANAIHVGTYHGAKGLEWPIVICTDFDEDTRTNLWGLNVVPDNPTMPFSMNAPLANRRLRYWPWPFGDQKADIALATRVENGPEGQEAIRLATT